MIVEASDQAIRRQKSFQEERARLFASPTNAKSSSTANDAATLQESLTRTQKLLQQELDRVSNVASALEQDGKILDKTMSHHQTLNVKQAKQALTALEREQEKERRILMASIIFFWCVVAYVLWGRILTHVPFFDQAIHLVTKLVRVPLNKAVEATNTFRQTEL
jgi:hypothetical protein